MAKGQKNNVDKTNSFDPITDIVNAVKDENSKKEIKTTKNEISDNGATNEGVVNIITKAIPLDDFTLQVPMPGQFQWNGACSGVFFQKNKVVTDPYLISELKKTERPVRYE